MILKNKIFQICLAFGMGGLVLLLPRPEGTRFKISGDSDLRLYQQISEQFQLLEEERKSPEEYVIELRKPAGMKTPGACLAQTTSKLDLSGVKIDFVDGLSPKAKSFLAVLATLVFLFIVEPIPLEVTAICIGAFLVLMGVADAKEAWAPYMHPVVVFIMCCLIFAIALDKAGLTRRLGYFIVRKAGSNVTKFTFIIAIGLGWASSFMHDAAACAIGIVTMLPLMKAAGIKPHTNTAKFMMLSLPFACSCGGMGTLVGGGRCMVSAAFLKEFTGIEITFIDWILYAMPAALIMVPLAVFIVYLVFRPDPSIELPKFDEEIGPWSATEKKAVVIIAATFLLWLTKGIHGFHYSVTGMLGVASLVLCGVMKWQDVHEHLEWGTALFIFGGGISLGLAMGYSGAAAYFANLFFPMVQGGGWFLLFVGVGVFGALITNVMANVAAAALILPIVIPMAQLEGVDPTILALCLGMATSFAMLLVIGCPPNAISYSYRHFKAADLSKAGVIATPVLLAVLVLVVSVWWRIIGLL